MLYSNYSKNVKSCSNQSPELSDLRLKVLTHLHSTHWYNELEKVLPHDWEKTHNLMITHNPDDVAKSFKNELHHRDTKLVSEHEIVSFLATKKDETVPGEYIEYTKRDNDFPYEANQWTINNETCSLTKPIFHVDHRLIWITATREIDFFSTEDITKIPFRYTIHIYTPSIDTLTNVENIKYSDIM